MTEYAIIAAQANDATVYLTSCDAWTPELALAEVLAPENHDWRLAFANRLREVTGAALRAVTTDSNGLPVA